MKNKPMVITRLACSGGPHGGKFEATVNRTSRNKSIITCDQCGATQEVATPGGAVGVATIHAMDDAVKRLHAGDA